MESPHHWFIDAIVNDILSVVNCFDDESLSFVRIEGNSLARLFGCTAP